MVRYKAITYNAANQQALVRYLYDEFDNGIQPERFLSDYQHHVYFPRELELLFRTTGFAVEEVWGDYQASSLTNRSRSLVLAGRKAASQADEYHSTANAS